jgi:SnoaL-like domain
LIVSDETQLISANRSFYTAFARGDFTAMDALWAQSVPVCCVHPGWSPVRGRDKVMSTWESILQHPPQPAIQPLGEQATIIGNVGMVVGFEAIGDVTLVATNIFVLEGGAWKMVHHQAAITERAPRAPEPTRNPGRLH